MKIYVASGWRNQHYPSVVAALRDAGHVVLDWRNPAPGNHGFAWSEIDPNWQKWTIRQFRESLNHPLAVRGFHSDFSFMQEADVCVLLHPCGHSAHLEAGWFCGQGKPCLFLALEPIEPELMYGLGAGILDSVADVVRVLS